MTEDYEIIKKGHEIKPLTSVKSLFEEGIENPVYGFHGTSIETIIYLTEHNRMPITGVAPSELFFFTNENHFLTSSSAYNGATAFAGFIASTRYIISQIPQFALIDAWEYMDRYGEITEAVEDLIQRNVLSKTELQGIYDIAKTRKGVIIALDQRIKTTFQVLPGDMFNKDPSDAEDNKIIVPQGLPLEYIAGIEPLGQYEWNVLSNL